MEAAIEAIRAEGTGTTGSRIANGSYSEHVALEHEIAEFYGKKHCMVFTTGYQANLGVISTLVGPEDFLLIDADSHASIYDACKQTQAEVVRFKHNDPASLDARLRRLKDRTRATSRATGWSCSRASTRCWAIRRRSRNSSRSARSTAPTC